MMTKPLFCSLLLALLVPAYGCGSDSGGGPQSDGSTNGDGDGDGDNAAQDSGVPSGGETKLTGTLGALGAVAPTVSSKWISNSGETLVYLTSAPLTCDQLMVSRWLGAFTSGAQVVEIVISGDPKVGVADNDAEVNFAAGGKSSAYETGADTGTVTFTKSEKGGVVEGHVKGTYKKPTGNVEGFFHAEFCPNGQGY